MLPPCDTGHCCLNDPRLIKFVNLTACSSASASEDTSLFESTEPSAGHERHKGELMMCCCPSAFRSQLTDRPLLLFTAVGLNKPHKVFCYPCSMRSHGGRVSCDDGCLASRLLCASLLNLQLLGCALAEHRQPGAFPQAAEATPRPSPQVSQAVSRVPSFAPGPSALFEVRLAARRPAVLPRSTTCICPRPTGKCVYACSLQFDSS